MNTPQQPLSFAQVAGTYDQNKDIFGDLSMDQFAQLGNYLTNSNQYDQGRGGAISTAIKRFGVAKDDFVRSAVPAAVDVGGDIGEGLFKFFGADSGTGRQVGEGSVTALADFLPMAAGAAIGMTPVGRGVKIAAGLGGLLSSSALSGTTAYTHSNSKAQAALGAAIPFAGGPLSSVGAKAAVNSLRPLANTSIGKALGLGGKIVKRGGLGAPVTQRRIASSLTDRLAGFVGAEVALATGFEAGQLAASALQGESYNPFEKENILANVLQTAMMPFSYAELVRPRDLGIVKLKNKVKTEKAITSADAEANLSKLLDQDLTPEQESVGNLTADYVLALQEAEALPDKEQRVKAKQNIEAAYERTLREPMETRPKSGPLFDREVQKAEAGLDDLILRGPTKPEDDPSAGLYDDLDVLVKDLEESGEPGAVVDFVENATKVNKVRERVGAKKINAKRIREDVEERVVEENMSLEEATREVDVKNKEEARQLVEDEKVRDRSVQNVRAAQAAAKVDNVGRPKEPVREATAEEEATVQQLDKMYNNRATNELDYLVAKKITDAMSRHETDSTGYMNMLKVATDTLRAYRENKLTKKDGSPAGGRVAIPAAVSRAMENAGSLAAKNLFAKRNPLQALKNEDGATNVSFRFDEFDGKDGAKKAAEDAAAKLRNEGKSVYVRQSGRVSKNGKDNRKYYLAEPKTEQADVALAGDEGRGAENVLRAADKQKIDEGDKKKALEAVEDVELKELLDATIKFAADNPDYDVDVLMEFAKSNPEAFKELATDILKTEQRVDDPELVNIDDVALFDSEAELLSDKHTLHQVRSTEDIPNILDNGLRKDTNVSRADQEGNQSLGDDATLVYKTEDLDLNSKGYNPGESLVQDGRKAEPVAVLYDRESIGVTPERTFKGVEQDLKATEAARAEIKEQLKTLQELKYSKKDVVYEDGIIEVGGFRGLVETRNGRVVIRDLSKTQGHSWLSVQEGKTPVERVLSEVNRPDKETEVKIKMLQRKESQLFNKEGDLLNTLIEMDEQGKDNLPAVGDEQHIKMLREKTKDKLPIYSYTLDEDGRMIGLKQEFTSSKESGFDGRAGDDFLVQRTLDRRDMLGRILKKAGWTKEQVGEAMPFLDGVYDVFNLDDVQFHEILKNTHAGAATLEGAVRKFYLSGKGLEGLSKKQQLERLGFVSGHEVGHLVEQLYRTNNLSEGQMRNFKKFVEWVDTANPTERREAVKLMLDSGLSKEMRNHPMFEGVLKNVDSPEEVRANLISAWAMSQASRGVANDRIMGHTLMPRSVSRFMKMLTDFGKKVYGALRSAIYKIPEEGSDKTRQNLFEMKRMLTSLQDAQFKGEQMMKEFDGVQMVGPRIRPSIKMRAQDLKGQSKMMDEVLAFYGEDEKTFQSVLPPDNTGLIARAKRFFERVILPGDQLAAEHPEVRGVFRTMHEFTGKTNAMIKQAVGELMGDVDASGNARWDAEGEFAFDRVRQDKHPVNNKIVSDWMRLQQEVMWPGGELKKDGEPSMIRGRSIEFDELATYDKKYKLTERLARVSEKDRKAILTFKDRATKSMQKTTRLVERGVEQKIIRQAQNYLHTKDPTLWKDAPAIALGMHEAIKLMNAEQPEAGRVMLAQIAQQVGNPETFQRMYDMHSKNYSAWVDMITKFQERAWFFSEIRNGKYLIKWREPDGQHGSQGFENRKDAQTYEKMLHEREGVRDISYEPVSRGDGRGGAQFGAEPEWMEAVDRMENAAAKVVKNMPDLTDEQKKAIVGEYKLTAEFKREAAASQVFAMGSNRKLAAGREDLDMVNTHIAYINASSRAVNRLVYNQDMKYHMANPELQQTHLHDIVEQTKRMVKNFNTADTKAGTALATGQAAYFLGLNLSSHMVELSQPFFSFVAELQRGSTTRESMSYFDSNKEIIKAQKDVGLFFMKHIPRKISHFVSQKTGLKVLKGEDVNTLIGDKGEAAMFDEAARRNKVSANHVSAANEADVQSTVDLTNLAKNGRLSSKLVSPLKMFADTTLKLYSQFTEFNARTALLVGYRRALADGHNHAKATELAIEYHDTVTLAGGKPNRPEAIFGGEEHFRTAGQAAYSLNGYTFGMLGMNYRYANEAFSKKSHPNLTKAERTKARKALMTLTMHQFIGAGLLGMPFIGAAMAMLEQFSDAELNKGLREGLAELFQEDEEEGGLLSDIVLYGGANAFSNQLLPGAPDFGSRFALTNVMGTNAYDGFSLDQLAGPTGSIVKNIGAGLKAIGQEGDFERAVGEWAPIAFKKYLELARNDGELRDSQGGLLIEATAGEKFAYAAGFTPQRARKMRDIERIQRRHEEVSRRGETQFHDEVAELYSINPGLAMQKLNQRAMEEEDYDKDAGARKVAERIEKRTLPHDPRRNSSYRASAGEDALLRASGFTGEPTEMQRLQIRNQVQAQLGSQPSSSPSVVARAQMIDQIMTVNPYMPRAQAAARVDEIMRTRSQGRN